MRGGILLGLVAGSCLLSVLAAVGAFGDVTAGSADITVEYEYPSVSVRLTHSTSLRAVLKKLCEQTNTDCELGPGLDRVPLEPMTVQGTWFEVVRKLFEGVSFDVAAAAPSPAQAGRLLVKNRPSTPAKGDPASVLGADGAILTKREVLEQIGGDGGLLSSPTNAEPDSRDQGPQTQKSPASEGSIAPSGELSGMRAADGTAAVSIDRGSAIASSSTGQAIQPAAGTTPNEDQTRTSLQASHDIYIGPMPGSLPLPPPGIAIFPFPDESGNPISVPVTNQPISVLPFPDSEGRPISVPPGVPGRKVQFPFPNTPIRSN